MFVVHHPMPEKSLRIIDTDEIIWVPDKNLGH